MMRMQRWKANGVLLALVLTLGGLGCGPSQKDTVKVDGKSYPKCSRAILSDLDFVGNAIERVKAPGLSTREKEARLADLEKELRIFWERYLQFETCGVSTEGSETVLIEFPAHRDDVDYFVQRTLRRVS